MKGNGHEARHISLLYVFVIVFGLDPAQARLREMLEKQTNGNISIKLFN